MKSPFAREVIKRIAAIEARVRGTSGEIRLAARQNETTRVMEDLKKRMTEVRWHLVPILTGGGNPICSASLGRANAVLVRRTCVSRFEHGGAFDAPDCSWKTQFIVRRQRKVTPRAGLYWHRFSIRQSSPISIRRPIDLSVRRPRTHRLGSHQGRPRDAYSGRRMSTQRRSKPSPTKHPPMTAVAMPLEKLDLWLQSRTGGAATNLSMLDSFVIAVVPSARYPGRRLQSWRHARVRGDFGRGAPP